MKIKIFNLLFCGLFPIILYAQSSRKILDFNNDWLFSQDDWIGVFHASSMKWDESKWTRVRTPHSFNAEDTFDKQRGYYRGYAWYRKHFSIPETEKGRILKINFGAIGNESEIWVNEKFMGKFTSGYTPVEVDITDVVSWTHENLIAIRVNNLHNDEIPPGRWRMDYNVYGGIYREVSLVSLSEIHFADRDFFVQTPEVSPELSKISVSASVRNTLASEVHALLQIDLEKNNKRTTGFSRTITIPAGQKVPVQNLTAEVKNAELWSPSHPELYMLKASLIMEGKVVDQLQTRIGFRRFEFDPSKGFILNGSPLKLHGLNRHQCYPGLASAVPERLQIEDARLLKDLGANFVRCSHYPHHPAFLDACDSLGILVYEEVASWQHIGGSQFIGHMDDMMEEMIRRDRNHPSVILWGMMNEGRSHEMFERLKKTAHQLDPARPVSYAENHIDLGIGEGTIFQPDVLGLNYDLEKYDRFHSEFPDIPLINTESTNADKSLAGDLKSQLAAVEKISKDIEFVEERPYLAGICIWCFHDYGTEYEPVWPIQTSGVVTEYRDYKEAAWYLKSRWTEKPFVRIAGDWNREEGAGTIREVKVWSNCEQTDLFLNGEKMEKQAGLTWKIPFRPGELKAVGKSGNDTMEHVIRTAGKPVKILCTSKYDRMSAGKYDVNPVSIQISDNKGITVPENERKISFNVTGPGKLAGIGGQTGAVTKGGIAHMLVVSTGVKGEIEVSAVSPGLTTGTIRLIAE